MCIKSTENVRTDFNNTENPDDYVLLMEDGMSKETVRGLESMGHSCKVWVPSFTYAFGRGNIIFSRTDIRTGKKVLSAGCDGRTDGHASGY
jgi:gamma-glutamyltranspeptidase/glutathione hydrolase